MYIFRSPELDEKLGLTKVNTEEIKREVKWQSIWFKKLLLCSTVLSDNVDNVNTIVVDTTTGVSSHLSGVVGTICDKMLQAVYLLVDVFPVDPLLSMQDDNMKRFKLQVDVEVNNIMTTVVPSYLQKASQMVKTCILDAWSELYLEYNSFQNKDVYQIALDDDMLRCEKNEFISKCMQQIVVAKYAQNGFDDTYNYVLNSLNYAIMKRNRLVKKRIWVSLKLLTPEVYAEVCYNVFMFSGLSNSEYRIYIDSLVLKDVVCKYLNKTTSAEYLNIVQNVLKLKKL